MGKKIFQAALLPALATAFFSGILSLSNMSGDLFLPAWLHKGVLVFLEILVWFSGGWLFNRMLSLLFWNTLVKKISSTPPPLMLVQLSGIFVLILTLSLIAHFVFDESTTTIIAAAGGLGFVLGFAVQGLILDLFSGLALSRWVILLIVITGLVRPLSEELRRPAGEPQDCGQRIETWSLFPIAI